MDVWGPTRTTSIGGKRYYLTCIDDYSRHVHIYFLKTKGEASCCVQEYMMFINTQYGFKPKAIRSDNGREYVNDNLQQWCRKEGVKLELTAPRTPEQNGVAERYNRTIGELMRAMLSARNVPEHLWTYAAAHAVYVRNRAYTATLPRNTPLERWCGERPNATHLYEFGAPIWVLREGENQSKLEVKALKHMFVGFVDEVKGIRYYDTRSHQVKTTRNFKLPSPQREGEDADVNESTLPDRADMEEQPGKKRKRIDENIPPHRSTRPKVIHDYAKLDDPPLELVQLLQEENDSPIKADEVIYNAISEPMPDGPDTLAEARAAPDWPEWEKAIKTELAQLEAMGTWELVKSPKDRTPVKNKWVLKRKYDKDGVLIKHKVRLVAKGFSQVPGMDYNETFAPVVRMETIRVLIAEAVRRRWKLRQMDVKGAYLNGYLKKEVYMEQPEGYNDTTGRAC